MKIWKAKSNLKLQTKKLNEKIDWLNHFIGFVVVVLGILIAFQLNEYSQENAQRKLIDKHIDNIRKESEVNLRNLKGAIAYGEQQLNDLDTMLTLIKQERSLPRINRLSIKLLNLGGSYLRKNAYSLFLESGDMRFMNDFEEQKKIINLYEYYEWLETFNRNALEHYRTDYYPYLKDNFDLATRSTFRLLFKKIRQYHCHLPIYALWQIGKVQRLPRQN
jgi:hypothetical protein